MEAQRSESTTPSDSNVVLIKDPPNEYTSISGDLSSDRESSVEANISNNSDIPNSTENDFINVDDIELSDEDSWLYTSPKKLTNEEKGLNLYKWLRKDVEDLGNVELQIAKTALVSKLEELDILSPKNGRKAETSGEPSKESASSKTDKDDQPFMSSPSSDEFQGHHVPKHKGSADDIVFVSNENRINDTTDNEESPSSDSADLRRKLLLSEARPLNSIMDVHEVAKLQEESLRQSSCSLLNHSQQKICEQAQYNPLGLERRQRLLKPASVEALHPYNGKQSPPSAVSLEGISQVLKSSPQNSPFGSTASLNYPPDVHRSSLPNLNKGYYSLRTRKSKRPSEPRIQCPLPVYPMNQKVVSNGSPIHAVLSPTQRGNIKSPSDDYRESHTLPSSYRIKSQKPPLSKKESASMMSSRRESAPSPLCQNNNVGRERSCPDQSSNSLKCPDTFNPKRLSSSPAPRVLSPSSPRLNGVHTNHFQRYSSSPALHASSRSPSLNHLPGAKELPARLSPSSSRQPFSSMHNQSSPSGTPKQDILSFPRSGELKKPNLPSKIPSPNVRSGIPVPSSPHISRSSHAEDTWSQGCF